MELKKWRRLNELSLNDLAKKMGVDESTLSNYESGRRFPRPVHLSIISNLTNNEVSASDMVETWRGKKKVKAEN